MQIGICTFMYLSDNWFNRTMQQSSQEGIHFLAKAFHTVFSKCIITAADKGKWRLLISSFSFWKNHYLCHSLLHHYSRHISALRFIWVIIICNQGSEILSYPFVVNNQLQVFHPFSIFVPVPYPVIMLKLFFTWYWISTISDCRLLMFLSGVTTVISVWMNKLLLEIIACCDIFRF